jgi:hypothetical protein
MSDIESKLQKLSSDIEILRTSIGEIASNETPINPRIGNDDAMSFMVGKTTELESAVSDCVEGISICMGVVFIMFVLITLLVVAMCIFVYMHRFGTPSASTFQSYHMYFKPKHQARVSRLRGGYESE